MFRHVNVKYNTHTCTGMRLYEMDGWIDGMAGCIVHCFVVSKARIRLCLNYAESSWRNRGLEIQSSGSVECAVGGAGSEMTSSSLVYYYLHFNKHIIK